MFLSSGFYKWLLFQVGRGSDVNRHKRSFSVSPNDRDHQDILREIAALFVSHGLLTDRLENLPPSERGKST